MQQCRRINFLEMNYENFHSSVIFMISAKADTGMQSFGRTEAFSSKQAKGFVHLRVDDELTDFTILSGEKSYSCHRVILASCSPVLKAMMMSGMREASKQEVRLDSISPRILELLIDYMYTGEMDVPDEHLLAIVETCEYLELLELKERCLSKAVNVFKPSNIISWFKLADSLNAEELKTKCSKILSSSISDVAEQCEFLELSLDEVTSYVEHVEDKSSDPDDVLEATLAWIRHNPSDRLQCMEDLLKNINLLECSVERLQAEMKNHKVLLDDCPAVDELLSLVLAEIMKADNFRQWRRPKTLVIVNSERMSKECLEFTPFFAI